MWKPLLQQSLPGSRCGGQEHPNRAPIVSRKHFFAFAESKSPSVNLMIISCRRSVATEVSRDLSSPAALTEPYVSSWGAWIQRLSQAGTKSRPGAVKSEWTALRSSNVVAAYVVHYRVQNVWASIKQHPRANQCFGSGVLEEQPSSAMQKGPKRNLQEALNHAY